MLSRALDSKSSVRPVSRFEFRAGWALGRAAPVREHPTAHPDSVSVIVDRQHVEEHEDGNRKEERDVGPLPSHAERGAKA